MRRRRRHERPVFPPQLSFQCAQVPARVVWPSYGEGPLTAARLCRRAEVWTRRSGAAAMASPAKLPLIPGYSVHPPVRQADDLPALCLVCPAARPGPTHMRWDLAIWRPRQPPSPLAPTAAAAAPCRPTEPLPFLPLMSTEPGQPRQEADPALCQWHRRAGGAGAAGRGRGAGGAAAAGVAEGVAHPVGRRSGSPGRGVLCAQLRSAGQEGVDPDQLQGSVVQPAAA